MKDVRKSILMGITTLAMSTLAMSMFAVAATTGPLNILSAYADREVKEKHYEPEDDESGSSTGFCVKDGDNCKDEGNVNKQAREACEEFFDSKCKKLDDDHEH
jgi:hypothetical protein